MKPGALRSALGLAVLAACVQLAPPARAAGFQPERPLVWNPAWPKFRNSEFALTGIAGTATIGLYFGVPDAEQPRWVGGVFADDWLRGKLRLRTPNWRDRARHASDITALSTLVWAVGIDSLVVPVARHGPDVATQLALMDTEAFAVSSLFTTTLFKAFARARPSYDDCRQSPLFDPLCAEHTNESFPSGHTSVSFTAAGLSCTHHLHAKLYGNRAADALACAGSIALAASTGTLRVLGDRHYATDVWVGALIGFAVGYGMPTLLHYGKVSRESDPSQAREPVLLPIGPTIAGSF